MLARTLRARLRALLQSLREGQLREVAGRAWRALLRRIRLQREPDGRAASAGRRARDDAPARDDAAIRDDKPVRGRRPQRKVLPRRDAPSLRRDAPRREASATGKGASVGADALGQEETSAGQEAPAGQQTPAERGRTSRTGAAPRGRASGSTGTTSGSAAPRVHAPAGRFVAGTIRYGLMARDYKLFIPPAAIKPPGRIVRQAETSRRLLPLVVMLHGCNQDPDDFAIGTGMNRHASADGFFVLYPAQSGRANRFRCWNWFSPMNQQRDLGEPGLIAHLIAQTAAEWPIDLDRIYCAGLSAGGGMTAILAACYPERFAAVAIHSGVPVGAARTPGVAMSVMKFGPVAGRTTVRFQRPPPMLVIQGDQDEVVHPDNAARLVADAVDSGATADECSDMVDAGRTTVLERYRDATGRILVESWRVRGLGHAWSGGQAPGSYTDPAGPDATAGMLRFFRAHKRRDPGQEQASTVPAAPEQEDDALLHRGPPGGGTALPGQSRTGTAARLS